MIKNFPVDQTATQRCELKPDYYFNGDLENVITLVKVQRFIHLLKESEYNHSEIDFLEEGFTEGFSIEYNRPTDRQSRSENIPFTVGNKTILWNKLMKEVKLGRVAGPFEKIPFKNYIQSPIGLVPKAGGDGNGTRLIFYLSYDFKRDGLKPLNHFTPDELCMVKYCDLDFAVSTYLKLANEIFSNGESDYTERDSKEKDRKRKWKDRYCNKSHRKKKQKNYIRIEI